LRFLFFLILFIACDIREVKDDSIVAKVGESELKKSDLADVVPLNISESDSIEFVENFISNWIVKKSLFEKAEINLTELEINEIKNSTNNYYEELLSMSNYLNSFSVPLWKIINELGQKNKNIVFEGAQGSMLDIDFGTYPYVTSSNTISGQIFSGTGFSYRNDHKILGITKEYTTRVG